MAKTLRRFTIDIGVFLLQLTLGVGVVIYALWTRHSPFVFAGAGLAIGGWLALRPFVSSVSKRDERVLTSHNMLDERGTLISLHASSVAFKLTLVALEYLFIISLLPNFEISPATTALGITFLLTGGTYLGAWVYYRNNL